RRGVDASASTATTAATAASVSVTSAPPASAPSSSATSASSAPATTVTTRAAASTTTRPVATSEPVPDHQVAASGAFMAGDSGAALAAQPGGPVTGRIRSGVAMGVDAISGGWAHVVTPCENKLWVKLADGHIEKTADIVIDAGHGGPEAGAVGQGGLTEKELNLAVARMVVDELAAQGVTAALARTGDYRQTLASQVFVATAMHPKAFVSIHHNAEPDGP